MIPPAFEYLSPSNLEEAVTLLGTYGDEAKILAGGHSLIPMMKLRLAAPQYLVDINGIPGLDGISESGGNLHIGAMVRESDLEESSLVAAKCPLLCETTRQIADPQVRNLATVGGNLAHGDPANDHPAAMLALGAELACVGPSGSRSIPIGEFFLDFFQTALGPNEILTSISVPIPPARSGGAYRKLERKVGDFATAAAAVQLTLDESGACRSVGIGLTNAGPLPLQAKRSQERLRGQVPTPELLLEAAQLAAQDSQPSSDLRGSEDYKRAMLKELTKRALTAAVDRAKGAA